MVKLGDLQTDEYLLLSVQRALLGEVTPPLRAVSVDLDTRVPEIRIRFIFQREPSLSERDAASCAATVLIASDPAP